MTTSNSDTPAPVDSLLTERAAAVEAHLRVRLAEHTLPANLRHAIEYALVGGGKRLRPVLTLCCCEAVGAERDAAMPAAGAVELVHAFSLVHDDLPAMDDDDLRRGRPTLHRQSGEAMAILAGDAMLVLAFRLLSRELAPARAGELTGELAEAGAAMIGGQVYDTLPNDDGLAARDRLERIHRNKTAALIRGACRMGAISGGANQTQLQAVSRYGEAIGLMFQAVDDLLDVTQTREAVGKTTQKDAEQGKLTYPGLIGVEATREEIERLRQAAHEALNNFGGAAGPLLELGDYMAERQR